MPGSRPTLLASHAREEKPWANARSPEFSYNSPLIAQDALCLKTPPPIAPVATSGDGLLTALLKNNVEKVKSLLAGDPMLAIALVPGRREPPVLAALRCGCCPSIVGLLLAHKADPDATAHLPEDVLHGVGEPITPLATLAKVTKAPPAPMPTTPPCVLGLPMCQMLPKLPSQVACLLRLPGAPRLFYASEMSEEHCCNYAVRLLDYGANRHRTDCAGLTAAEHAEANGMYHLASLIRNWGGDQVKAMRGLRQLKPREAVQCCPEGKVCLLCVLWVEGVLDHIAEFLTGAAPKG